MHKSSFSYLLALALFVYHGCPAQDIWRLVETRNDITLSELDSRSDSLRHFKAEFAIPAGIKSCIDNLYHAELHVLFMDGMKSSELIRREHDKSLIFYQVLDLPWPIPNRDMVTHALFEHSLEAGMVRVTLRSVPDEKASTHMTRVNVPERIWTFTEQTPNSTQVIYVYSSNPSSIPYLLENTLSIDGPLEMMAGFKKLASQPTDFVSRINWIE